MDFGQVMNVTGKNWRFYRKK